MKGCCPCMLRTLSNHLVFLFHFNLLAEKGKMTYAKGKRNIPLSKVHETFGV